MKYLVMIYCDDTLLDALPEGEFDTLMHGCFVKADALRAKGKLQDSQQLEGPATARTVRVREGRTSVVDGPYAETKEMVAWFYVVEARDLNEAIQVASKIPPAREGSIEVRPVRQLNP